MQAKGFLKYRLKQGFSNICSREK